jgi:signal transduction histidine kinase
LLLERIATEVNDAATVESVGESLGKGLTEISRAGNILERFRDATDVAGRRIVAPLDIYQLAKRVMTAFAESAKNANLNISLKDMGFVAFMSMTGHELEQLFFILIQNAIDAADSDKRESLTISAHCSGKEIELQFADTCRGVDEKDVDRIFEPFFVSGSQTGRAGLGLAMARQIVTSHGGSIRAESKPDRGTTIFVSLPVERAY